MRRVALPALAAAVFFGISAPLAKRLLADVAPITAAGLLYAGAAMALLLARRLLRALGGNTGPALTRADLPRCLAVAIAGGLVAPVALMLGLARVSSASASLLLSLEGPLTLALAALALHEPLGMVPLAGAGLIFGGGALLGFVPGALTGQPEGAGLVALACLSWAVDNALTRKLSDKDPLAVGAAKGAIAAPLALAAGRAAGEASPAVPATLAALALGAIAYGASLALYVRSQRDVGVARTSALFAAAPFVGALVAWPVNGERPTGVVIGAGVLMALGLALLVRERHAHLHQHEPMEHEHEHVHDEHHCHDHREGAPPEPHSHLHQHERLVHAHPHDLDPHHRHRH